jgi:hypothetical protein
MNICRPRPNWRNASRSEITRLDIAGRRPSIVSSPATMPTPKGNIRASPESGRVCAWAFSSWQAPSNAFLLRFLDFVRVDHVDAGSRPCPLLPYAYDLGTELLAIDYQRQCFAVSGPAFKAAPCAKSAPPRCELSDIPKVPFWFSVRPGTLSGIARPCG